MGETKSLLQSLLLEELGRVTHFDEDDLKIARILESSDERGKPFDSESQEHRVLVKAIKYALNSYMDAKWPRFARLPDHYIRKLDAHELQLMIIGVRKEKIDSFRDELRRAIKIFKKTKLRPLQSEDPFLRSPNGALTYHVVKSLQEALPGLSQSGAIRVVIFLFKDFGIEPDKRIRRSKKKISKTDPLFKRLEQRITRFRNKFGEPQTTYSLLTRLYAEKSAPTK